MLMIAGLLLVLVDIGPAMVLSVYGGGCYVTVKDDYGLPVSGALVYVESVTITTSTGSYEFLLGWDLGTTDSQGKFNFGVSTDGLYELKFSKSGYNTATKSVTLTGGAPKSISVTLTGGPAPPPPPPEPDPPEGYFEINGEKVTKSSVVVLPYTQLAMDFTATSRASDIDRVTVKVKDQNGTPVGVIDIDGDTVPEITLTKQDSTRWATVFDLPGDGTYVVESYIHYGAKSLKMLSIICGSDVETQRIEPTYLTGFGLLVSVLGILIDKGIIKTG